MQRTIAIVACCLGLVLPAGANMEKDPEAKALLARFQGMRDSGRSLDDPLDGKSAGKATGPVGFGPGARADKSATDQAALFPENRVEAQYLYYGPHVAARGRISLEFRLDALPKDAHFMTLFSIGTGGNTCMTMRLGMDRVVTAMVLTRREGVTLFSDPVARGKWHRLEYWYGPEGAALVLDGSIEDYSTDYAAPYAHDISNAFYLGDQPWWDAGGHKAIFYPLDSFAGRIDNLQFVRLAADG